MGRFFLFREVRPRGDIPDDQGFEEASKDNQTMTSFPLHRSPPKQIVWLIANKDNQVGSLPENKATINLIYAGFYKIVMEVMSLHQ
jgi:hypothetical protein